MPNQGSTSLVHRFGPNILVAPDSACCNPDHMQGWSPVQGSPLGQAFPLSKVEVEVLTGHLERCLRPDLGVVQSKVVEEGEYTALMVDTPENKEFVEVPRKLGAPPNLRFRNMMPIHDDANPRRSGQILIVCDPPF